MNAVSVSVAPLFYSSGLQITSGQFNQNRTEQGEALPAQFEKADTGRSVSLTPRLIDLFA